MLFKYESQMKCQHFPHSLSTKTTVLLIMTIELKYLGTVNQVGVFSPSHWPVGMSGAGRRGVVDN